MKRIASLILSLVCALGAFTGCGEKNDEGLYWRIVSANTLTEPTKNGMFIAADAAPTTPLLFLDFSTMQESRVCDDPTCKHSNAAACPSFGKNNHPFIYNEKLYYFVITDYYSQDDRLVQDAQLWECNLGGRDETLLHTFKGMTYHEASTMLLYGSTIYMLMTSAPHDADFGELEPSVRLMSYDLDKKQHTDHGTLASGYSCGGFIFGVWEQKVILEFWTAKVNKPYIDRVTEYAERCGISPDEAFALYVDEYDTIYKEFSVSSGDLKDPELGEPVGITENYYYSSENGSLVYYDKDSKAHSLGVNGVSFVYSLDGYVSFNDNSTTYLFDERENELTKLDDFYSILAVYGEDELIIAVVHEDGSTTYEKKKLSELIKVQ